MYVLRFKKSLLFDSQFLLYPILYNKDLSPKRLKKNLEDINLC